MSDIYELAKVTPDLVVVKVKEVDNLTRALNPHMPGAETEYVSITRGSRHIMTFIKKDGSTWSIEWGGGGGCTMCADSLLATKREIIDFVQRECGVLLDWHDRQPTKATIYYNNNFGKWQLTLRNSSDEAYYWSPTATNQDDMIEECKKFVNARSWRKGIAMTGITIWEAIF